MIVFFPFYFDYAKTIDNKEKKKNVDAQPRGRFFFVLKPGRLFFEVEGFGKQVRWGHRLTRERGSRISRHRPTHRCLFERTQTNNSEKKRKKKRKKKKKEEKKEKKRTKRKEKPLPVGGEPGKNHSEKEGKRDNPQKGEKEKEKKKKIPSNTVLRSQLWQARQRFKMCCSRKTLVQKTKSEKPVAPNWAVRFNRR